MMHGHVVFDSEICKASSPTIPAFSAGALYGCGIFTTVAVVAGQPFLWKKHWRRLTDNAARLNLDLGPFAESTIADALERLILKNAVSHGRARITLFNGASDHLWDAGTPGRTHLLIATAESHVLPGLVKLTLSPFRVNSRSALSNVKSCNYLENRLVRDEASTRGFYDAVRLNERNEVVSTSMANLFWIKDGRLFTPSLDCGGLAGTTRELILENFEANEVRGDAQVLQTADEVFITSAGIGVQRAVIGEIRDSATPFTDRVKEFLEKRQRI